MSLPSSLRFTLASASPRRRRLLPLLGHPVEVRPTDVDETPAAGELPADTAGRLALAKARACAPTETDAVVVGADTIVVLDGRQLGKPRDRREAGAMLRALRGRPHQVITAVALSRRGRAVTGTVSSEVVMRPYADDELERYVLSGRPLDKAGAYAIQDREFAPVAELRGCYLNVVGLPLCEVARGLCALGLETARPCELPPCGWCRLGEAALAAEPD